MHTGSCLCGDVTFEIDGRLEPIQVCHCQQCRKAQGTAFATNIPVETAMFRITRGERALTHYEPSPGNTRSFCRSCGSPVYGVKESSPGTVYVRAGLINEALGVRVVAHFHTASKCNWWPIADGLPQFPGNFVPLTSRPKAQGGR